MFSGVAVSQSGMSAFVVPILENNMGDYPRFGELVRQVVDGRSTRAIQIKTSVSHSTVADMMKGIRPKSATIRLFADGMGVDPNPLLKAAGYPSIKNSRTNEEREAIRQEARLAAGALDDLPEIEREPDPEHVGQFLSHYEGDDPALRGAAGAYRALRRTERDAEETGPSGEEI